MKKIYLLNFGMKFNDSLLEEIKTSLKVDELEQIMVKVNLDLSKNPYKQCHDIVLKQTDYLLPKSDEEDFIINLPGLPIACVFIVNEIKAITGKEPPVIFTSKDLSENGPFSRFKFKRLFNLEYEKTVTREKFKNGNKN